jgi:hypothetical protein
MEHSKLPHSKLPWYTSEGIENRGVRNEDGFIFFLRPRPSRYQDQDERYERELREWEGDAQFIRKACNEHDTLKAKVQSLEGDRDFALRLAAKRLKVGLDLISKNQTLKAKETLLGEAMQELFEMQSSTGEDASWMHEYIEGVIREAKEIK